MSSLVIRPVWERRPYLSEGSTSPRQGNKGVGFYFDYVKISIHEYVLAPFFSPILIL
jgi:hypothetical protein